MKPTPDIETDRREPTRPRQDAPLDRVRTVARAVAGPLLIVLAVLLVLHTLAFRGLFLVRHPDVLGTFMPSWCFLGRTLHGGDIPVWNPHVMGGIPFAADPLGGWMYLPAMALFSILPCQAAMPAFIVLQPILAGLGIYAFLRGEGISRPGATVGGLVLGLPMASSYFVYSLPFTGMLAWTALTLAAASRLMASRTWAGRFCWTALTALAWGQLAGAHLSNGVVEGSLALAIYVGARLVSDVRTRRRTPGEGVMLLALLLAALPLVNLAYFLPRLGYLRESTLGLGYVQLQSIAARLTGTTATIPTQVGVATTFPLRLTAPPGLYLGALGVGLAFAAWRAPRRLYLAAAFAAYGALCYVLALHAVVAAAGPHLGSSQVGSFYLHEPQRFVYEVPLAIAVLAGLGLDGWLHARSAWQRILLIAPPVAIFAVLPLALGLHRNGLLWPLAGAATLVALAVVAWKPSLAVVLPCLLAAELLTAALVTAMPSWLYSSSPRVRAAAGTVITPFLPPRIGEATPVAAYVRDGPIPRALAARGGERYLSIAPHAWRWLGYHVRTGLDYDGLLGRQQSMYFGLEEGQGYNSIQLTRYWKFVRALDPKRIAYNAAGFTTVSRPVLDLLQVRYLILPSKLPRTVADGVPAAGRVPVARQGRWRLVELRPVVPRASLVTSWSVVRSADDALRRIQDGGFDPERTVILERDPGFPPAGSGAGGGVTTGVGGDRVESYRWTGLGSAELRIEATAPAIVLVRNTFERHWRANVDGRPAPVLAADYLDQGIPVLPGRHVIVLRYVDHSVAAGLAGTLGSLLALLGLAGVASTRDRRRKERAAAPMAVDHPPATGEPATGEPATEEPAIVGAASGEPAVREPGADGGSGGAGSGGGESNGGSRHAPDEAAPSF